MQFSRSSVGVVRVLIFFSSPEENETQGDPLKPPPSIEVENVDADTAYSPHEQESPTVNVTQTGLHKSLSDSAIIGSNTEFNPDEPDEKEWELEEDVLRFLKTVALHRCVTGTSSTTSSPRLLDDILLVRQPA